GEVLAVLLAGEQPVARVYIPETLRTGIRVGDQVNLELDGIEGRLAGRVRTISADPAFTPYFALTERERGRLSYVAEIELLEIGPATGRLPDGLPVAVFLPGQEGDDE